MKRPRQKFRIGQRARLSDIGILLVATGPAIGWPIKGDFWVLGVGDRTGRGEGYEYLIEHLENPNHPTMWVPETWLKKVKEVQEV